MKKFKPHDNNFLRLKTNKIRKNNNKYKKILRQ